VTENRLFSHRLIQLFNRYLEPGGEEAWVETLERSLQIPTCYFESADWTGPNAPPKWSQAFRMIYNPVSLEKLRQVHRRERAEAWIIHNAFPTGSAAIYHEAQTNRLPLIQYIHNFRPIAVSGYLNPRDLPNFPSRIRTHLTEIRRGSWQNSHLKTAWFAIVLATARLLGWFNGITAWIAVSEFMRDQFIRAGVHSERIFTLRHFWRPSTDIPADTFGRHYLFLGRLVEAKGILVLLDVWDLIWRDKKHLGPRLVICGDGPLKKTVRARTEQNPLVSFQGSVLNEKKLQLLGGMRALIAPSLCLESLGLVAYEAYDFAKPVLAARAGGLGEIVTHNQTGLLHEPGDVATLYEQVMTLEAEPAKRIDLGRNGREWLRENTDEQRWLRKFNEIVEFAIAMSRK
jgi:glycosyltransferase involved in cell wall biosynthesis